VNRPVQPGFTPSAEIATTTLEGTMTAHLQVDAERVTVDAQTVTARYTIDGGLSGKARLDIVSRVAGPATTTLLDRVGVPEGARCVDVGCGGGHVARDLARRAGESGRVVGVDLDAVILELAAADVEAAGLTNVELRCSDATELEPARYDLAYARLLLSHVADPGAVLTAMKEAVTAGGGLVVVEDIDFTGSFCAPACSAYDRYVEMYRETVRRRGGNADIGPLLPSLLRQAGLRDVGVAVAQPCGLEGEPKLISPLTLERIAESVVAEGVATAGEVQQTIAELYEYYADPTSLMSVPRIVQAWGRR
jgi:2-polyprenyl-3-methyl-5-hydroxy-6-metoxy-1,4-benzoquinol methylase